MSWSRQAAQQGHEMGIAFQVIILLYAVPNDTMGTEAVRVAGRLGTRDPAAARDAALSSVALTGALAFALAGGGAGAGVGLCRHLPLAIRASRPRFAASYRSSRLLSSSIHLPSHHLL